MATTPLNTQNSFAQKISESYGHPSLLINAVSDRLEEISEGRMVNIDPNNSVAIMTEAMASLGSALLMATTAETRRIHKSGATSMIDLYRHMSDYDYENRFSRPATDIPFIMMFDYNTLMNRAKVIPNSGGRRKITIPRHTTVEVSDIPFTTEYPIDIFVLPHGAITILQNNEIVSTLKTLKTNRIGWTGVQTEDGLYIAINVPMDQCAINRKIVSLSSLSSFKQTFTYTDEYYHCRAYMRDKGTFKWREIRTTHQDTVYDPNIPTVCIRVLNQTVVVTVPQIYFNNGTVGTDLRLDFYTTKGPIDLDLSTFDPSQYKMNWKEIDDANESIYIAPLKDFQKLAISSMSRAQGGSLGATFDELRQRVVGRDRAEEEPIHEKNLPVKTALLDYDIVLKKDIVTDRKFVATRALPVPANKDTVTGMDLTMMPLLTRLVDLVGSESTLRVGNRMVLRPGMLFRQTEGVLDIVSDEELAELSNPALYPPERLVSRVNQDRFLYTPFHYVVDVNGVMPTCRAYVMDQPNIAFTQFVQDNDTAGITLSALNKAIWLREDGTGYVLAVQIDPSTFPKDVKAKQIGLQLSHKIAGSSRRIYYPGHLTRPNRNDLVIDPIDPETGRPVDDQWVYYFFINTEMDVDSSQNMSVEGFRGALGILTEMDLVYYTVNYRNPDFSPSDIDSLLYPRELPGFNFSNVYSGLTQEKLTVQFGEYLEHLWTRIRTIDDTTEYETYRADVPLLYEDDVYEHNPETLTPKLYFDPATGKYHRKLLHRAGDVQRVPGTDEPVIQHYAGDYVKDGNDKLIPIGGELNPIREIDLFLLDGTYYFANDEATVEYRNSCIKRLVEWITLDVSLLAEKFYAKSDLHFYPKRNMGYVKVVVGNRLYTSIPAEQNLKVTYFVPKTVNDNVELKDKIEKQTAGVIDQVLQNTTISLTDVTKALRLAFVDHVMEVKVEGLFEDLYDIVTIADESVRPSIAKKLKLTRSQTIMVGNGVEVTFEVHSRA